VWKLLGAKLRFRSVTGFSCAPSAALLALLILPIPPAAGGGAVARGAADQSPTSDEGRSDYGAGQSAYATGRFSEALRVWRPLAESGDPRAAFGLGLLYDLGEGVGQDAAAAYLWYRRAAEAGFVPAEFNIAVMYDSGLGTARNAAEAAVWYASAAAHGNARAEYNLAQLYAAGEGVPRNLDVAEAWYAAAAAHGLSAASSKLTALRETRAAAVAPAAAAPAAARTELTPAIPTGPVVTPKLKSGEVALVELSWVAPAQRVPVNFFVQVLALDVAGAHPAFASYLNQSAILARLPSTPAEYAWRVYTVAASVPDYVPSTWSYFSLR
jgi:Sel1 repeat